MKKIMVLLFAMCMICIVPNTGASPPVKEKASITMQAQKSQCELGVVNTIESHCMVYDLQKSFYDLVADPVTVRQFYKGKFVNKIRKNYNYNLNSCNSYKPPLKNIKNNPDYFSQFRRA